MSATDLVKCNFKVYRGTGFTEDKHVALSAPLSTLNQYKTPALSVEGVKLERSLFDQIDVTFKLARNAADELLVTNAASGQYEFDYMMVTCQPTETGIGSPVFNRFYFVKSVEWKSANTIAFRCRLDAVSTLTLVGTNSGESRNALFDARTHLTRQHKNRWRRTSGTNRAVAEIDRYDEGISPAVYRTSKTYLTEDVSGTAPQTDNDPQFNVVYRNRNLPNTTDFYQINPVDYHLTLDNDTSVVIPASATYEWTPATFISADGYWYLLYTEQAGMTLTAGGVTYSFDGTHLFVYKGSDGKLHLYAATSQGTRIYPVGSPLISGNSIIVENLIATTIEFYASGNGDVYTDALGNWPTPNYSFSTTSNVVSIKGIHGTYDRTAAELIRICKVPFSPVAWSWDNGQILLPSGWSYDSSCEDLRLDDGNSRFTRKVDIHTDYNIITRNVLKTWTTAPALNQARDASNEPKLKHSAFHQCKIVYDSFALPIAWENFTRTLTYEQVIAKEEFTDFYVDYTVSATMSGNFMIHVPFDDLFDRKSEDYPFFLTVARNNQEPIFTSAYVNYLRNGYNYDVKAKNLNAVSAGAGIGLSVAGGAAAVALGSNPATAAIGAVVGVTASIVNAIVNQQRSENSIQQKLQATRMQAVTISGSDDVDLMVEYAKNKFMYVEYDPSPEMSAMLFNLFYYFGYACDDYGVPNVASRKYFNFIQGEAVFKADVHKIPMNFVEEAQRRIREGITLLHIAMQGAITTDYENWEVNLL